MSTAEAAQRWAEAKDKLGAASAAMGLAVSAHDEAHKAEREAWDALEALAGRSPPPAASLPPEWTERSQYTSRARMNGGVIERE